MKTPFIVAFAVLCSAALFAQPKPKKLTKWATVEELVLANHILVDYGVIDAYGHVSVRDPQNPNHFLLAHHIPAITVTAADIVEYDFDANPTDGSDAVGYSERFIHSEIYRARPDVHAIVHSHSPSVIPFGVTAQPLRPVFHMSGFLGSGTAHFDIRDVAGDTDMLISNRMLGEALAAELGPHSCVLMRGHGSTVIGSSLEQAVYRAIYAEVNARLQIQAIGLGDVMYLNEGEAAKSAATNDTQLARVWELWSRKVGAID